MRSLGFSLKLAAATSLLVACGGGDATRPPPGSRPLAVAAQDARPPAPTDVLGPRPALGDPAAFVPPHPTPYTRPNGLTVWVLERHALPVVSMQLVVPAGAAQDPEGKGGLAATTANMLDEGAGTRGPLEISRDIDRLGATLRTGATADYAFVSLTTLKKNLAPAGAIFGDVVSKPRMDPVEFKRIHDLWENQLRARQSEPQAVANVVVARKLYPAQHPYAHPTDGTLTSAAKVALDDVKKFYGSRWRPDRAHLVVVGDVTRAEIDSVLDKALDGWKKPADAASAQTPPSTGAPGPGAPEAKLSGRHVYVVDRPDAPQSVISVARPGPSAFDDEGAALIRVNGALGGSFTSRLNQDLREEHGWSYGAHSRFSFSRLRGAFVASAAVHTEHTGDALKAMLADVEGMAKDGLSDEEVEKTRRLARVDLVDTFETVEGTAARFARNVGVGHTPGYDETAAQLTNRADKAFLKKLSGIYLDLSNSVIVIVGPRAKIEPQLKAIGITNVESTGPEGQ